MPSESFVIRGTIKNSHRSSIENAKITFTTSQGSAHILTDSSGKYVFDLANIGYTIDETVSYSVEDEFNNEISSGTFTATGTTLTQNSTLEVRSDKIAVQGNRDTQIFNIGGKPVSKDNPLPVDAILDLEQSKDMEGNGKVSVGTTGVEVSFSGVPKSIIISADTSNTGTLYVGDSTVTSSGTNALVFLEAGESLEVDYTNYNPIYVVASVASQNYWSGCLK